MKKIVLPFLIIFIGLQTVFATHYRAGVITYQQTGNATYVVTVYTYTTNIYVPPDRDTLTVDWGDGTSSPAPRINGEGQPLGNNIKVNVYETPAHIYTGSAAFRVVSMEDPNRMDGILNIDAGNSSDVPFFIEDTIFLNNGCSSQLNNSPLLLNQPIYYANVSDTFKYNPGAFAPFGDSMSYQLVPSLQALGSPVPNYIFPDQVTPSIDNIMSINSTGEITWITPQEQGPYNVAVLITSFREGTELGTVLFDMMIIVQDEEDNPPQIHAVKDTCVMAGTLLNIKVNSTDPDPGQSVSLSAFGGPLNDSAAVGSMAYFTSDSAATDSTTGNFSWQTNCKAIRHQPYQIIFVATDDYPQTPLTSQVSWNIHVIAPGPQNLSAVSSGSLVTLTWDSTSACDLSETPNFIGYSVWRSDTSVTSYAPDTCTPGLEGSGYTWVAGAITSNTYSEYPPVSGNFCYRVQADFGIPCLTCPGFNPVSSLPSNEVCTNVVAGIASVTNGAAVTFSPNPVSDVLYIHSQQPGAYRVELFDLLGQSLMQQTYSGDAYVDVSHFAKGMYIVRYTVEGRSGTGKILVE